MFILDSLFLSGFRWVLDTVRTAAEAEMNDDAALRDELLAAEMRREMGEISDGEFARIEADLLARIRAIRERREGGAVGFGAALESAPGTTFEIDAAIAGDFHEPIEGAGTVIEGPAPGARPVAPQRRAPRGRPSRASRATGRPRARRKPPRS